MSPDPYPADPERLAALLVAVGAADRVAFKALYGATSRRLFGVAMMILRRRDAAEDVVQEAYVRIWTHARQYDPSRGAALAWLMRVARNLAIDQVRRERRVEDIADHAETLAAPAPALTDQVDLNRALTAIRPDYRQAISLAFIDGYTHEELAERNGVPLGTAKARVRRGLDQLRTRLQPAPLTPLH
jgi:RNA polymerase sigma-70 factor (ECF subfamily)